MLFGQIEVHETPRVDQFENTICRDRELPCWVKAAMPRLFRVAQDDKLRVVVWKRMCRQELYLADQKYLSRIEMLAQACNMPLRTVRG